MNNPVLDTALDDFNMDYATYNELNKAQVRKMTNKFLDNSSEKRTLSFSQQILLNNKKKQVSFLNSESTENSKKSKDKDRKKKTILQYDIPCVEYIDVCLANASNRKKHNHTSSKIQCKKYLI